MQTCLVTQSCLTLCNPMDCSPPSSSVHGNLQARILQWVSFSRGSSQARYKPNFLTSSTFAGEYHQCHLQSPNLPLKTKQGKRINTNNVTQGSISVLGSCLTRGNELSEETHVLTKQEIFFSSLVLFLFFEDFFYPGVGFYLPVLNICHLLSNLLNFFLFYLNNVPSFHPTFLKISLVLIFSCVASSLVIFKIIFLMVFLLGGLYHFIFED